jgi:hypothetical protein
MERNKLITIVDNIIVKNISLMSRYISPQNDMYEHIYKNILNYKFNGNEELFSEFINDYFVNNLFEKYDFYSSNNSFIKYFIANELFEELKLESNNIINSFSYNDIYGCVNFRLNLYESDSHYGSSYDYQYYTFFEYTDLINIINTKSNQKNIILDTNKKISIINISEYDHYISEQMVEAYKIFEEKYNKLIKIITK